LGLELLIDTKRLPLLKRNRGRYISNNEKINY